MKKRKTNTKKIVALIFIILALVAATTYFFWYKPLSDKRDRQDPPTVSESDKKREDGTPIGRPDPTPNQQQAVTIDNIFSDSINIYTGTTLTGISSGVCRLQVKQGDTIITKNGQVELLTSYYGCTNMRIAKSEIKKGKLTMIIIINSGDAQIASNEKEYDNQ